MPRATCHLAPAGWRATRPQTSSMAEMPKYFVSSHYVLPVSPPVVAHSLMLAKRALPESGQQTVIVHFRKVYRLTLFLQALPDICCPSRLTTRLSTLSVRILFTFPSQVPHQTNATQDHLRAGSSKLVCKWSMELVPRRSWFLQGLWIGRLSGPCRHRRRCSRCGSTLYSAAASTHSLRKYHGQIAQD